MGEKFLRALRSLSATSAIFLHTTPVTPTASPPTVSVSVSTRPVCRCQELQQTTLIQIFRLRHHADFDIPSAILFTLFPVLRVWRCQHLCSFIYSATLSALRSERCRFGTWKGHSIQARPFPYQTSSPRPHCTYIKYATHRTVVVSEEMEVTVAYFKAQPQNTPKDMELAGRVLQQSDTGHRTAAQHAASSACFCAVPPPHPTPFTSHIASPCINVTSVHISSQSLVNHDQLYNNQRTPPTSSGFKPRPKHQHS